MKPVSLPIKSFLIRKLAVDTMIPEKDLEVVINHQFSSAIEATAIYNSIEISGFGKFLLNMGRAQRAMKKFLSLKEQYENALKEEGVSEKRRITLEAKLKTANDNIRTLNPKLK